MIKSLVLGGAAVLLATVPAFACKTLDSAVVKLSACIDDSEWSPGESEGAQEFVYFTNDQTVGMMMITENAAVASAAFRQAILDNAKGATSKPTDKVEVVGERIATVSGKPWNVLEYELPAEGTPLHFQNFYFSQPGFGSVQVIFWSEPAQATAAAYQAGQFLATTTFK